MTNVTKKSFWSCSRDLQVWHFYLVPPLSFVFVVVGVGVRAFVRSDKTAASRGRFAGFDLVKWKRIFVDGIASQPVKRNKLAIILNWFLTVRSFSDVSENYFPLFTFHFPLFIFHFHFHFPFSTFHFWIFTFHFSLFTFHKNFRIFLELDIWKNRCISLLLLL